MEPLGDTRGFSSGSMEELSSSHSLNYPTPSFFDTPAEAPMLGSGDLRALFGWVFPDSDMNDVEFEVTN